MSDENKVMMFGKSQNQIGNTNSHTTICTAGDIYVKTKNRYLPIFKNGKLNVNDSSEIFSVGSMEDIKKTGIYLVTSQTEEGEANQSVYLNIDGTKILLASSSEGYISYAAIQELKPEEFLQAAQNMGMYFNTLEDAKNSGIQQGMVYILEEQKLYKIVKGEFVDINAKTEASGSTEEKPEEEPKEEELTSLRIGAIFIDGVDSVISGDDMLIIKVNDTEYIKFQSNLIQMKRDVVLDPAFSMYYPNGVKGESGFWVYTLDGESYLEIDNLIVHNSSTEYSPKLYSVSVGTSTQSLIQSAIWENAPTDIQLTLKYPCAFAVGDHIMIQTAGGNEVTFKAGQSDTGAQLLIAELETPPTQNTTLNLTYTYKAADDSLVSATVSITINPNDTTYSDGTGELNNYAEVTIPGEFYEVTDMTIASGDQDVFYTKDDGTVIGNSFLPVAMFGTVTNASPLTINVPAQENTAQSVLRNLENSPIYKITSAGDTEYVLWTEGTNMDIREFTDSGSLEQKTVSRYGDLSGIPDPYDPSQTLEGYGIYSNTLVGEYPKFYGATFMGSGDAWYPNYGPDLSAPAANFDDAAYDKVVPNIEWVKKLIQKEIDQLRTELTPPPPAP